MRAVNQSNVIKHVFHDLTENELLFLSNFIVKKSFEPGELILAQGSFSESLYIIDQGEVIVSVILPGDTIKQMAVLSELQIFDEVAFLAQDLTTATMSAKTYVNCTLLTRSVLNTLRIAYPKIAFKIERVLVKQTEQKIIFNGKKLVNFLCSKPSDKLYLDHTHQLPISQAQHQELYITSINRQLLDKLAFFTVLTDSQIKTLLMIMRVYAYDKGYQLNQNLGKVNLVFSGAVMCFLANKDSLVKSIGIMGIGEVFFQQFFSKALNSLFKFVTCEESIILELDVNKYYQLKRLDEEIFYKVNNYINTAFVSRFYIINRQFIRINCEYMNVAS
ncbi:cyclic nucleotide-binding protein [Legionella beliardensis]|uniref:Cyclic nucleotide-binding protein n=1 Tax=Legionella beliardensis TaxID=91822 RepID=A0A378I4K5_9GAMM|nr:cyclic nucleotide-binding domain-containing protein [Legionella beliardensis]STX30119.1 cyclic nucleotide-binding protein [Legionella beliardensis]